MRIIRILIKLAISLYIALVNLIFSYIFYFLLISFVRFVLPNRYISDIRIFLGLNGTQSNVYSYICFLFPIIVLLIYFIYCISPLQLSRLRRELGYIEPRDYDLRRLNRLMQETGINKSFKLYLKVDVETNANAFGFSSIGVTSSMLENASDVEIKGVLCHEYGHIVHKDYVYRLGLHSFELFGVKSLYGIFYSLDKFIRIILYIPRVLLPIVDIIVNLISTVWWVIYQITHTVVFGLSKILTVNINKYSEYRCDKYAVYYGHGEGLLLFLKRIKDVEDSSPKQTIFERLHNEHPSTRNRIRRLEKQLNYRRS